MSAHVTGDGGAMAVLNAVAAVAKTRPGIRDRRFNLIHCYFPTPEMAALARSLNAGSIPRVTSTSATRTSSTGSTGRMVGAVHGPRRVGQGGVPVGLNSDHMIGFDPGARHERLQPLSHARCRGEPPRRPRTGLRETPAPRPPRRAPHRHGLARVAQFFDEESPRQPRTGKLADFVVLDGTTWSARRGKSARSVPCSR